MRTIKFKAKRIDTEEWVYGDYFKSPLTDGNSGVESGNGWFFLSDGKERHCISQDGVVFVVDPETVGQYIGLRDKNGKEIYEHDIIKLNNRNMLMEYTGGSFGVLSDKRNNQRTIYSTDMEVIGNIHDNPELLK